MSFGAGAVAAWMATIGSHADRAEHPAAIFYTTASPFPPAFGGDRLAYLFAVFGQFGVSLLVTGWGWRLAHKLFEDRHPFRDPITMTRVILLLLMTGTFLRTFPGAAQTMLWPEIAPSTRAHLAFLQRMFAAVSFFPTTLAWLAWQFSGPVISFQLTRQPIRVDLYPSWQRIRQPIMIGSIVMVIAIALSLR